MFNLTPFNKSKDGRALTTNSLWDNFFETGFPLSMEPFSRGMRVNIKEEKDKYLMEAELPGFNKEDISIQLKDDVITVMAEQNEDLEEKGDSYLRRERRSGRLARSFAIDNVKHEAISAKYENGVLHVTLPKENKKPATGKRIDIQ